MLAGDHHSSREGSDALLIGDHHDLRVRQGRSTGKTALLLVHGGNETPGYQAPLSSYPGRPVASSAAV